MPMKCAPAAAIIAASSGIVTPQIYTAFVKALASGDVSALQKVSSDSSIIAALDPRLAYPFKVGFSASMDQVFLIGAVVCAIGFVVLLFLPDACRTSPPPPSGGRWSSGTP